VLQMQYLENSAELCQNKKSDISSLYFVINRFLNKIFNKNDIATVKLSDADCVQCI